MVPRQMLNFCFVVPKTNVSFAVVVVFFFFFKDLTLIFSKSPEVDAILWLTSKEALYTWRSAVASVSRFFYFILFFKNFRLLF